MEDVYILDGLAETALSSADEDMFSALLANTQPISKVRRFDTSRLNFHSAFCINSLEKEQREAENLIQTLLHRLLSRLPSLSPVDAIIWAGVKGNVEFIDSGAWSASPDCPYPYLPRHYSQWIRESLGYKKAHLIEVNAACASSTFGMAIGAEMISSGRFQSVLIIAADIVTRFAFAGFSALNALAKSACRPFDKRRDGLLLGDGAVALLMAGEQYTEDCKYNPSVRISGWGISNDANHITAPARDGRGLIAAITLALNKAGLKETDIGAFCAHGTGTVYNDAMELTAIEAVFGDLHFPMFSIKGAVGHTLGAAGGIEVLVCTRALSFGQVPPTAGLEFPEPEAHGRVLGEAQTFDKMKMMTTNSGFGGVNVALILDKV